MVLTVLPIGPLFSHVAVALSDRVAIEAGTAADEGDSTWSGAPLGEGVRLQLLPDLIMGAAEAPSCVIPIRTRFFTRASTSTLLTSVTCWVVDAQPAPWLSDRAEGGPRFWRLSFPKTRSIGLLIRIA